ncbi:uncharacterized protein LOC127881485 isoform X2 [Dreissena polymorpha]|nr:uncharacterized protein LOC127881485 isoform X2 [Dreissena polymorpha]
MYLVYIRGPLLNFLLLESWIRVSYGDITLRTMDAKAFFTIECMSHVDITIRFCDKLNHTHIIAECDAEMDFCFLVDKSFAKHYAVFYTGEGAILNVLMDTEETLGKYTVCETYNSGHCESMEIMALATNSSYNRSDQMTSMNLIELLEKVQNCANVCNTSQSVVDSMRTVLQATIYILVLTTLHVAITVCVPDAYKASLLRLFRRMVKKSDRYKKDGNRFDLVKKLNANAEQNGEEEGNFRAVD